MIEAMKRELTLTDLQNVFLRAIETHEEYIGIRIEMPNLELPEVIINPRKNFKEKLEYYLSAYDNDLKLKSCKNIKITGFMYGSNYQEIQDCLNC